MSTHRVPLAEHFHSIQGEGRWMGTPMHFLRFPGCNVGKRAYPTGTIPILPNGAEATICHAWDGKEFWCDTDYKKHDEASVDELVEETFETAVCFTGGEPLMHQGQQWYRDLIKALDDENIAIHLETSGTYVPDPAYDWVTVSPKKGWLPTAVEQAHQLKFLVSDTTTLEQIKEVTKHARAKCNICLSPIFDPNELVRSHLDQALSFLVAEPTWKLSVQVHKWLGLQ